MGMGLELYQNTPEARAVFDQADEQLGFALSQLCFTGPEDSLTDTVNQQPALFVTSLAMWQRMQAQGWEMPAYMAGHSLGELSALTAAGALSFADGLRLVRQRGELMKAAGEREPGAMAAILALDIPTVKEICEQASDETGAVQVANDNCPGQVVISGDEAALTRAMALAEEAKARKVVKLPITIAAHSRLMASAAEAFAEAVSMSIVSRTWCVIVQRIVFAYSMPTTANWSTVNSGTSWLHWSSFSPRGTVNCLMPLPESGSAAH